MNSIINNAVAKAIGYEDYTALVSSLWQNGELTGGEVTEDLLAYTKLNIARMRRVEKTAFLSDTLIGALKNQVPNYFLILTEGWCGDAAQLVPLFDKMNAIQGNKETLIVLRDENLELMDLYLTNGKSRSIPIVLCISSETNEVLWQYGPRPKAAQKILDDAKLQNLDLEIQKEMLHKWYAEDKTKTTQEEILTLLEGRV
jgi:Thioredoxin